MIGERAGAPLGEFLMRTGAVITAKYVGFECVDGYDEGMDTPTALHTPTIVAPTLSDAIIAPQCGFPFKIRVPTKLDFKSPQSVTILTVTNHQPRGFWSAWGYNWFGGI